MPFCRRKCPYCDFFKKVPGLLQSAAYFRVLQAELDLAVKVNRSSPNCLETVYFGGGTPSLHPPEEIARLLRKIEQLWPISPEAEITLEANPGDVTPENAMAWRKVGISRLSIGAQSFSPRKLGLLYRDHQTADNQRAVANAHSAGFENVSLDLIFGLPGETLEEWKTDIHAAIALVPRHVSLYNLEYHEATPFHRWRQSGRITPLSEDLEAEMYRLAHEVLTSHGYEHYEISNFARPGFRSRHNWACWQGKPYLGLGPSAHSFDGQALRWNNVADLDRYTAAIECGDLPIENETTLSPREKAEEWIALNLRTSDGVQHSEAVHVLGEDATNRLWQRAERLPESLRIITPDRLTLTPDGWFRENSVLVDIFEALA